MRSLTNHSILKCLSKVKVFSNSHKNHNVNFHGEARFKHVFDLFGSWPIGGNINGRGGKPTVKSMDTNRNRGADALPTPAFTGGWPRL